MGASLQMKIVELIEQYDIKTSERERKTPFSYDYLTRLDKKNNDKVSAGWYSRAVQHPSDPHQFIKSTKLTSKLDRDAFHKYIQMVVSLHKRGIENPYFPSVYEIKVTRDPKQNTRPQYHLQKLHSFREFDQNALAGMVERMFEKDDNTRLLLIKHRRNKVTAYDIWDFICTKAADAVTWNNYDKIKDKNLIQALRFISALSKKYWFNNDMHIGNFMIRITNTGPQLVITDPLSDSGESMPSEDEMKWGSEDYQEIQQAARKKLRKRLEPGGVQTKYAAYSDTTGEKLFSFYAENRHHAYAKIEELYRQGKTTENPNNITVISDQDN